MVARSGSSHFSSSSKTKEFVIHFVKCEAHTGVRCENGGRHTTLAVDRKPPLFVVLDRLSARIEARRGTGVIIVRVDLG